MEIKKIILVLFLLLTMYTKVNTQKRIISVSKAQIENVEPTFFIDVDKYLKTPYLWGGTDSNGIDCSALTQSIFRDNNIDIPRVSYRQYDYSLKNKGTVSDSLIFFLNRRKTRIGHVAIKIGDNQILHSISKGVTIDTIGSKVWESYFMERLIEKRK